MKFTQPIFSASRTRSDGEAVCRSSSSVAASELRVRSADKLTSCSAPPSSHTCNACSYNLAAAGRSPALAATVASVCMRSAFRVSKPVGGAHATLPCAPRTAPTCRSWPQLVRTLFGARQSSCVRRVRMQDALPRFVTSFTLVRALAVRHELEPTPPLSVILTVFNKP
jgi:hypothetical protein